MRIKFLLFTIILLFGIQQTPVVYAMEEDEDANSLFARANNFSQGNGGVKKSSTAAFEYYEKAAEKNHVEAQYILGNIYYDGEKPLDKSWYVKGINFYKAAATNGHAEAQYILGNIYYEGKKGIEKKDANEAFKWWSKASDQGHIEATYNIGWCYDFGDGIERNLHNALELYEKAAKQGHKKAKLRAEYLYHITHISLGQSHMGNENKQLK